MAMASVSVSISELMESAKISKSFMDYTREMLAYYPLRLEDDAMAELLYGGEVVPSHRCAVCGRLALGMELHKAAVEAAKIRGYPRPRILDTCSVECYLEFEPAHQAAKILKKMKFTPEDA